MLHRPAVLGLAACLLLATSSGVRADEKAVEAELKKMDGEWIVKAEGGSEVRYIFKGDKLEVVAPSRTYKITVKLDPGAKPEKTIDFQIDDAPEDAKGKTTKSIYKFEDDDTLIICMRPEGERPTKFEQVGFEQFLSTLKKKKS